MIHRIGAREVKARTVRIELPDGVALAADLAAPEGASGAVLFAHGSGSGRRSPRNRAVAAVLNAGGLATLLLDLLTEQEQARDARTGLLRFDIDLLAARVIGAIDAIRAPGELAELPLGVFGASTGAAAALIAAAERPDAVGAVVSRGGRPDLAGDALPRVRAPVLLIVGGRDHEVLGLHRVAIARLGGPRRLEVVPGATHLFEEPGALEEVARLAREHFVACLIGGS